MKYLLVPKEDLEFLYSLLKDYDVAFNIGQKNANKLKKLKEKKYSEMERPF
jgi:hypothetical protein